MGGPRRCALAAAAPRARRRLAVLQRQFGAAVVGSPSIMAPSIAEVSASARAHCQYRTSMGPDRGKGKSGCKSALLAW